MQDKEKRKHKREKEAVRRIEKTLRASARKAGEKQTTE